MRTLEKSSFLVRNSSNNGDTPVSPTEVWANRTVVIDAVKGNNTTAIYERIDKPFQTFAAALAALPTSGDLNFTFIIRPGTYTEAVDFDAYLNTSPAYFEFVYQSAVHQGVNSQHLYNAGSASKIISLKVYGATISQTFAKQVYYSGNSANFFYLYDCTVTNTGGSIFASANNNMRFYSSNITSTVNFSNGFNSAIIDNCKITITAGGLGAAYGTFYLINSILVTSATIATIRGVIANNCILKSTTSDCFTLSTAASIFLYNCTFVSIAGKYPIKTNALTPLGAANFCSGVTATLSDSPTLIDDNYFRNTQNAY